MEELKEKYRNLETKELNRLYKITDGKEKECIKNILRRRGVYLPFDVVFPGDDDTPVEPEQLKRVLPIPPETLKPKFRNPEASVDKIANTNNRQPQFFKVYYVISEEFGYEVALLIDLLASKQRYYRQFKKLDSEGCFYLEHPRIQEMTGMGEYSQKKAMAILSELKILYISPKKKGTPPKKFYRVNIDRYDELVEKLNRKKDN